MNDGLWTRVCCAGPCPAVWPRCRSPAGSLQAPGAVSPDCPPCQRELAGLGNEARLRGGGGGSGRKRKMQDDDIPAPPPTHGSLEERRAAESLAVSRQIRTRAALSLPPGGMGSSVTWEFLGSWRVRGSSGAQLCAPHTSTRGADSGPRPAGTCPSVHQPAGLLTGARTWLGGNTLLQLGSQVNGRVSDGACGMYGTEFSNASSQPSWK